MLTTTIILVEGVLIAAIINWAIYNLAYYPKQIGPWAKASQDLPTRTWIDTVPILGWWRMRRESKVHGRGFWLRPLLIEIFFPLILLGLYTWEMSGGIVPLGIASGNANDWKSILQLHFVVHSILIALMVVATFIDIDERTIPDAITIWGTLAGIVIAACFPHFHFFADGVQMVHLHPISPWPWPAKWSGPWGLFLGLFCYSVWCFAIADRVLILRRGWKKAIQFFFAALVRYTNLWLLGSIWLLGMLGISLVYARMPAEHWQSLFTSLVGVTLGCSIVWSIRIVGGLAMKREAMGFGDVTLMAMVGAYMGWQPTWIAFVAAPVLGLIIVIICYLLTGDSSLPFGPYLVVGSLVVLLGWDLIWREAAPRIEFLGPLFFPLCISCLLLMGGMLWVMRLIREISESIQARQTKGKKRK